MNPALRASVLVSTHTQQGLDVLEKQIPETRSTFAPFDTPALMDQAFALIAPKVLVLIELELWPGMLAAAKKRGVQTIIVNGRLTPSSHKGYRKVKALIRAFAPKHITAISEGDASRLKDLFPLTPVQRIPNIKFDRIPIEDQTPGPNPLSGVKERTLYMLASVRQEEEPQVAAMCRALLNQDKTALIAWFPRHMERVPPLIKNLSEQKLSAIKRSQGPHIPPSTSIIIWDTFGEMGDFFHHAHAAFVGGSFAPLGGQNMLEPLACGLIPIMGPSYDNFAWAAEELLSENLLILAETPKEGARRLIMQAQNASHKKDHQSRFKTLIAAQRGGTQATISLIEKHLPKKDHTA